MGCSQPFANNPYRIVREAPHNSTRAEFSPHTNAQLVEDQYESYSTVRCGKVLQIGVQASDVSRPCKRRPVWLPYCVHVRNRDFIPVLHHLHVDAAVPTLAIPVWKHVVQFDDSPSLHRDTSDVCTLS